MSALKVARGLAGGDDAKIAFIDTEARRALHYAPGPNEKPSADRFGFQHAELLPPFTPEAYKDIIERAEAAGFAVIVIDSMSHEYEGEGGLHEMHEANVQAMVDRQRGQQYFDEAKIRERSSIGAWKEPKLRHKRLVNKMLQCRSHLVICLRAEEKIRLEKVKDDKGRERTVIVQAKDLPPIERWTPICEKRFMYEMTVSFVLDPAKPGYPIPIKLQEQHRAAVPLDRPLSEETGELLAKWARGDVPVADPWIAAEAAARQGMDAMLRYWSDLPKDVQRVLNPRRPELRKIAEEADAATIDFPGDRPVAEAS